MVVYDIGPGEYGEWYSGDLVNEDVFGEVESADGQEDEELKNVI